MTRTVRSALTAGAVCVALIIGVAGGSSANTIRHDLKHQHVNYGHVYDDDTKGPKYVYSGGWPYVYAASQGVKDGEGWTHTHSYVTCFPTACYE